MAITVVKIADGNSEEILLWAVGPSEGLLETAVSLVTEELRGLCTLDMVHSDEGVYFLEELRCEKEDFKSALRQISREINEQLKQFDTDALHPCARVEFSFS